MESSTYRYNIANNTIAIPAIDEFPVNRECMPTYTELLSIAAFLPPKP